jgi:hypothetical protein
VQTVGTPRLKISAIGKDNFNSESGGIAVGSVLRDGGLFERGQENAAQLLDPLFPAHPFIGNSQQFLQRRLMVGGHLGDSELEIRSAARPATCVI